MKRYVAAKFKERDHEHVLALIQNLSDELGFDGNARRVLRSVLSLANGQKRSLEHFVKCARENWRDVIVWAGYEDGKMDGKRTRDFGKVFKKSDFRMINFFAISQCPQKSH